MHDEQVRTAYKFLPDQEALRPEVIHPCKRKRAAGPRILFAISLLMGVLTVQAVAHHVRARHNRDADMRLRIDHLSDRAMDLRLQVDHIYEDLDNTLEAGDVTSPALDREIQRYRSKVLRSWERYQKPDVAMSDATTYGEFDLCQ